MPIDETLHEASVDAVKPDASKGRLILRGVGLAVLGWLVFAVLMAIAIALDEWRQIKLPDALPFIGLIVPAGIFIFGRDAKKHGHQAGPLILGVLLGLAVPMVFAFIGMALFVLTAGGMPRG